MTQLDRRRARPRRAARARSASSRPEIVFHLAAQALVRASYREPVETYATNVHGHGPRARGGARTRRRARGRRSSPATSATRTASGLGLSRERAAGRPRSRTAAARAARSSSPPLPQLVLRATAAHGASRRARAGNVIGGGDWAADRLDPRPRARRSLRGEPLADPQPGAIRPWQHVLEPLDGYLLLAERLCDEPCVRRRLELRPGRRRRPCPCRAIVDAARRAVGRRRALGAGRRAAAARGARRCSSTAPRRAARLGWAPRLALRAGARLDRRLVPAHAHGATAPAALTLAQIAPLLEARRPMTPPPAASAARRSSTSFVDLGMSPLSNSYLTRRAARRGMEPLLSAARLRLRAVLPGAAAERVETPEQHLQRLRLLLLVLRHLARARARLLRRAMIERFGLDGDEPGRRDREQRRLPAAVLRRRAASRCSASSRPRTSPRSRARRACRRVVAVLRRRDRARARRGAARSADLLLGNNVLAHVPDLNDFVAGLKCCSRRAAWSRWSSRTCCGSSTRTSSTPSTTSTSRYFSFLTVRAGLRGARPARSSTSRSCRPTAARCASTRATRTTPRSRIDEARRRCSTPRSARPASTGSRPIARFAEQVRADQARAARAS